MDVGERAQRAMDKVLREVAQNVHTNRIKYIQDGKDQRNEQRLRQRRGAWHWAAALEEQARVAAAAPEEERMAAADEERKAAAAAAAHRKQQRVWEQQQRRVAEHEREKQDEAAKFRAAERMGGKRLAAAKWNKKQWNAQQRDLAAGEPGAGVRSSACPMPSRFALAATALVPSDHVRYCYTSWDPGCPLPQPATLALDEWRSQQPAAGASPPGIQCELPAADGQAAAEEEGQAGVKRDVKWCLARIVAERATEEMLRKRLAQAREKDVVVEAEVRSAEDVQAQVWQ